MTYHAQCRHARQRDERPYCPHGTAAAERAETTFDAARIIREEEIDAALDDHEWRAEAVRYLAAVPLRSGARDKAVDELVKWIERVRENYVLTCARAACEEADDIHYL